VQRQWKAEKDEKEKAASHYGNLLEDGSTSSRYTATGWCLKRIVRGASKAILAANARSSAKISSNPHQRLRVPRASRLNPQHAQPENMKAPPRSKA
jgi:hypothetical protein